MLSKWDLIEVNGDQDSKYEATERVLNSFRPLRNSKVLSEMEKKVNSKVRELFSLK